MEGDESFDEFYTKFKDIENSAFNLGKTILDSRLLERYSDLYLRDFMPRSSQLRNQRILTKFLWQSWLATYRPMNWVCLGSGNQARARVWHWRPKVVILMSLLMIKILRWNPTLQDNSKSLWRMPMLKDFTKIASCPVRLSSRAKTKGRRMLGMAVNTLFSQDQSVLGVKVSDTWNKIA